MTSEPTQMISWKCTERHKFVVHTSKLLTEEAIWFDSPNRFSDREKFIPPVDTFRLVRALFEISFVNSIYVGRHQITIYMTPTDEYCPKELRDLVILEMIHRIYYEEYDKDETPRLFLDTIHGKQRFSLPEAQITSPVLK